MDLEWDIIIDGIVNEVAKILNCKIQAQTSYGRILTYNDKEWTIRITTDCMCAVYLWYDRRDPHALEFFDFSNSKIIDNIVNFIVLR